MFDQNSMNRWLSNVAIQSGISSEDILSKATPKEPKKGIKQASKRRIGERQEEPERTQKRR